MAYATEADVEALMAQVTISATTSLTSTELAIIIDDVAGEIDTALASQDVVVPVTAPTYVLNWLEGVNSMGATARALRSLFPDVAGMGEQPAFAFWQRLYDNALKGIRDGSMIPPDLARSDTSVAPSTYLTRNPDDELDLGDIAEPFFKVGQVF